MVEDQAQRSGQGRCAGRVFGCPSSRMLLILSKGTFLLPLRAHGLASVLLLLLLL